MSKKLGQLNKSAVAKGSASLHTAAVILGRAGGKVGGPRRARALSQERRTAIARQGGRARHHKHD